MVYILIVHTDTQDMPTISTVPEDDLTKIQLRVPMSSWRGLKIQAIREDVTAEQLAAKAFDLYLLSVQAQ